MTSIKDRVYMGFEEDIANLEATLDFYKGQQKAIKETIKSFKLLKLRHRKEIANYLNTFYNTMDTIEYRERTISIMPDVAAQME